MFYKRKDTSLEQEVASCDIKSVSKDYLLAESAVMNREDDVEEVVRAVRHVLFPRLIILSRP